MGIVISKERLENDDKMQKYLSRYTMTDVNDKYYESEFKNLDIINPDAKYDYFIFGDLQSNKLIIKNDDSILYSDKIININLDNTLDDIANEVSCIIDKYHWYELKDLKIYFPNKSNKELLKELIESIEDKNKYLTILTFHC